MTTLRLALLALVACLLLPATGLVQRRLLDGGRPLSETSSCGMASGGDEGSGVAVLDSMSEDEPDDDDVVGEDADGPVAFDVPEMARAVTGRERFGCSGGLPGAPGVRGGLFRPPRAAA